MTHEVQQHAEYIRAALKQDRRPLGLMLGAGAAMAVKTAGSSLVPDIAGLTALIGTTLTGGDAEVVQTAMAQLSTVEGASPTVEDLLGYLRTLSAVPGDGEVRGFTLQQLRAADRAVCALIRDTLDVALPRTGTPFHAMALWTRAAIRHAPIELFTTNYDLLIEQALESLAVPYFDGFVGSRRPAFDLQAVEEDRLPTRWVRLWKLHGSINWQVGSGGAVVRCAAPTTSEGTLIYPSHLKYAESRRLPYLALLDRVRSFLRQPSAVLVSCGFAYRDEHINEVIDQALRSNPTATVQALLFGSIEQYPHALSLATRTPNLSLLAGDEAVIGLQRGKWAPTLDPAGSESAATCELGDFEAFGRLLRDITGPSLDTDSLLPAEGIDVP